MAKKISKNRKIPTICVNSRIKRKGHKLQFNSINNKFPSKTIYVEVIDKTPETDITKIKRYYEHRPFSRVTQNTLNKLYKPQILHHHNSESGTGVEPPFLTFVKSIKIHSTSPKRKINNVIISKKIK